MAYQGHPGVKGYDPSALKNMQKTQFRLDDGHNFYNDYGTTMKASYVPKETTRKPFTKMTAELCVHQIYYFAEASNHIII